MDQPIIKPMDAEMPEYYRYYVGLVPENDLVEGLKLTSKRWEALLTSISMDQFHFRYAEGKWSLAEVLMHLMDTERIFAYRAFRFSRNDGTVLPGFDENYFIAQAKGEMDQATPDRWLQRHRNLRNVSIDLFEGISVAGLDFLGNSNGLTVTPRALGFMIVGHDIHHLNVIQDRYLSR
jgi:uncharacterized damage-inducible protein DinB